MKKGIRDFAAVLAMAVVAIAFVFLLSAVDVAQAADTAQALVTAKIREHFLRKFPRTQGVDEVRESPIQGIYEIATPRGIFYFHPEKELMIFGEIWDSTGKSLTAERRAEISVKKLQDLPMDKAVTVGNGKNTVIEFVDPECPHCRAGYNYLKDKDVTVHAFVVPLFGPRSEKKVRYLLCSGDRVKAYHEIMTERDVDIPAGCNVPNERVSELKQLAMSRGITGVPFFLINGKPVSGANTRMMDQLLGKINPGRR